MHEKIRETAMEEQGADCRVSAEDNRATVPSLSLPRHLFVLVRDWSVEWILLPDAHSPMGSPSHFVKALGDS